MQIDKNELQQDHSQIDKKNLIMFDFQNNNMIIHVRENDNNKRKKLNLRQSHNDFNLNDFINVN